MDHAPKHPGELFAISGSYWQSCTIHAGVKLDIFTPLGKGAASAKTLAEQTGLNPDGLTRLLNALCALGLLVKTGQEYANTSFSLTHLSKTSVDYIGHIIMHHHHLVSSWSMLDQAVTSGQPVGTRASFSDEKVRESFLMGMFNLAKNLAPMVVKALNLSSRRHLLDLGGGPGTYAIYFCRENPALRATVFDLPETRPFAEKTIADYDLADRIDFREGDFLTDVIEGSFDAAWISHILHAEGPGDCRRILNKAVGALKPGGMIVIHDFFLTETMDAPLFPALFSLNMLLQTTYGRAYSENEIVIMLTEAGVNKIERLSFQGPNDSGIITGVVA